MSLIALVGPIAGALFSALLGFVTQWLVRQQAQQLGAAREANAVQAHSLQTITAEAQAEANAPSSQSGVVSSLEHGSF
jgi:hypothetical protein